MTGLDKLISGSGDNVISGNVRLGNSQTIEVTADSLRISGVISQDDPFALTKNGTGTLELAGASTYSGGTNINAGVLAISNDTGAGTGVVNILGSGTLDLSGGITAANNLNLTSSSTAVRSSSGTNTLSGPISLGSDSTIDVSGGTKLTQTGVISGSGRGVIKVGAGELVYRGSSSYTYDGTTRVNEGTLVLDAQDATIQINGPVIVGDNIGTGATLRQIATYAIDDDLNVLINEGASYDLDDATESIDTLTLQGGTVNISAGSAVQLFTSLSTNATTNNLTSVIQGAGSFQFLGGPGTITIADDPEVDVDARISAVISGSSGFNKEGAGVLALSGANTYSGTTGINAGTLLVDGTVAGAVALAGGTLAGTGTITGAGITTSGTPSIDPGPIGGTGILTYSGSSGATLASGTTLKIDINGSTVGTGYDQFKLTNSSALFDPN